MRVDLVSTESELWRDVLARSAHDVYHLPEYVSLSAGHDEGEPLAFVAEEGDRALLLPLVLRPIPSALATLGTRAYDAASPYGYSGPIVTSSDQDAADFIRGALTEMLRLLSEMNVVSVFVRLHPLLPFPTECLAEAGSLVSHGHTVAIDLDASPQVLRSQIRKTHRRFITKLEQVNHEMVLSDSPERIPDFLEIYRENMDRVGASSYYYFPEEYFHRMLSLLPGKVQLAFLDIDGEHACVDLLTEVGGLIECHLGATRTRFLTSSPSIPLTYYECLWAKDRGNRLLHLGGGLGGEEDSLFAFKAGFTKLRFPFSTWRAVVDRGSYERLTRAWERNTMSAAESVDGFFPAYRKAPRRMLHDRTGTGETL